MLAAVRPPVGDAAEWAPWTARRYDDSKSTVNNRIHRILRQTGRVILLTAAFLYFLIDLIFFSIVRPLRRRLMALKWVTT